MDQATAGDGCCRITSPRRSALPTTATSRSPGASTPSGGSTDLELGDLVAADRPAVAALHDQLFPGTHPTGTKVADGNHRVVLVARDAGSVVGYVAA